VLSKANTTQLQDVIIKHLNHYKIRVCENKKRGTTKEKTKKMTAENKIEQK
jgi:hypothetical protein